MNRRCWPAAWIPARDVFASGVVLAEWLQVRRTTVARNTYQADADLARLMPASLLAMNIGVVGEREIARSFEALLADGLAEASVRRYRALLSALFGWAARA